jgi:hypothetical protein
LFCFCCCCFFFFVAVVVGVGVVYFYISTHFPERIVKKAGASDRKARDIVQIPDAIYFRESIEASLGIVIQKKIGTGSFGQVPEEFLECWWCGGGGVVVVDGDGIVLFLGVIIIIVVGGGCCCC